MSIQNLWQKIKPCFFIILIALISYGIGRLTIKKAENIQKEPSSSASTETASNLASVKDSISKTLPSSNSAVQKSNILISTSSTEKESEVVASKTSKKYFFPWCGSAKRIKPENKITFPSPEKAREAGLLPAANCKGLK